MSKTRVRQLLEWTARLVLLSLVCVSASIPEAPAQETGGLPGFLMHLFGGGAQPKPPAEATPQAPVRRPRPKKIHDFVPSTTTRAPGAIGGAPIQAKFFVDVLGDSLAVMASDGLTEAFSDKPEIGILDKARDASGLVRDDYFDWAKAAGELTSGKDRIDFVVVMLGINDIQPLRDGSDVLDPLSDKWRERYGQRVENVVTPFHNAHIPVVWVGLPPMRTDRVNAEVIKLNEIFKERAEKAGAKYIDIWDAFADQSGQYNAFGPNIEGQSVKLRGPDGIHFTKAGGRKLAHFLEAEIRRVFEKKNPVAEVANLPPDIEQAADDINAQIRREMGAPTETQGAGVTAAPAVPIKPLAGPILPLTAHPVAPGGVLISAQLARSNETESTERVLREGQPPAPRSGRSDDFVWPRL